MRLISIMTVLTVLALGAAARAVAAASDKTPVQSVAKVDQARFMGGWYEIARLPNRYQKGCAGSYTDFSLRDDGQINVVNSCRNAKDGSIRQSKGRAWMIDPSSNARLKVSFFWPFRNEYWIIELGEEYQYSVVASPDRKFLWILSRTATMSDDLYSDILLGVERQGFDVKNILKEIQGA
jgi:apolipoprotein D and lipocalin family protein